MFKLSSARFAVCGRGASAPPCAGRICVICERREWLYKMAKTRLGFALCGSFCTFSRAIDKMSELSERYDIYPIMSQNAASIDTRFGTARGHIQKIEDICRKKVISDISAAEPIGPKDMIDILLIAPCTGNTLAKLANSVTDTSVTMAAKSHLRVQKPVVIALASNDSLAGTAKNLGHLLNYKNYFFVPFGQDNPIKKPFSIVSDFDKIDDTIQFAMKKEQIQPILI